MVAALDAAPAAASELVVWRLAVETQREGKSRTGLRSDIDQNRAPESKEGIHRAKSSNSPTINSARFTQP